MSQSFVRERIRTQRQNCSKRYCIPKFVAAATLPDVLCQRSHASCYQAEVNNVFANNVFAARTERTGRDTITARRCDQDAGLSSS